MVLLCKGLFQDTDERAIIRISPENTVKNSTALKIELHCDGCSKKIRKVVSKFKGVEMVSMDNSKDLVTVKGTMNVEELVSYLRQKLKKNVEVVPPAVKKDKDHGERKGKESSNAARGRGDWREKQPTTDSRSGVGPRKEEGSGRGGSGNALKAVGSKQLEFYDGYAHYPVETAHEYSRFMTAQLMRGPQIFSDENPNACCVV